MLHDIIVSTGKGIMHSDRICVQNMGFLKRRSAGAQPTKRSACAGRTGCKSYSLCSCSWLPLGCPKRAFCFKTRCVLCFMFSNHLLTAAKTLKQNGATITKTSGLVSPGLPRSCIYNHVGPFLFCYWTRNPPPPIGRGLTETNIALLRQLFWGLSPITWLS